MKEQKHIEWALEANLALIELEKTWKRRRHKFPELYARIRDARDEADRAFFALLKPHRP